MRSNGQQQNASWMMNDVHSFFWCWLFCLQQMTYYLDSAQRIHGLISHKEKRGACDLLHLQSALNTDGSGFGVCFGCVCGCATGPQMWHSLQQRGPGSRREGQGHRKASLGFGEPLANIWPHMEGCGGLSITHFFLPFRIFNVSFCDFRVEAFANGSAWQDSHILADHSEKTLEHAAAEPLEFIEGGSWRVWAPFENLRPLFSLNFSSTSWTYRHFRLCFFFGSCFWSMNHAKMVGNLEEFCITASLGFFAIRKTFSLMHDLKPELCPISSWSCWFLVPDKIRKE